MIKRANTDKKYQQESFSYSSLNISTKIGLLVFVVSMCVLSVTSVFGIYRDYQLNKAELVSEAKSLIRFVANRSAAALAFFDEELATENLNALSEFDYLEQACLYDSNGLLFARYIRIESFVENDCSPQLRQNVLNEQNEDISLLRALLADERSLGISFQIESELETQGTLIFSVSLDTVFKQVNQRLIILLFNLAFGAFLSVILARTLVRKLVRPIVEVQKTANKIISSENYSIRADVHSEDEVGKMADAFNSMLTAIQQKSRALQEQINRTEKAEKALIQFNAELEETIEQRTEQLSEKNNALNEALETLKIAQDDLLQSEKLASLGSIVASVAHELNTPLGICITTLTSLEAEHIALRKHFDEEKLSRSFLISFLDKAQQYNELSLSNINRACELIRSFKQVAVDQTSEARREFKLFEKVTEVINTLKPTLKKQPHKLSIENVNESIVLDSYPGPLGQVITNLVLNCYVHAFTDGRHGHVVVKFHAIDNNTVQLSVSDDGVGIPKAHIKRIFDPFFTSKLGQGGSGLGLNIVYKIVTSTLGGSIKVESSQKEGTTFIVTIPLNPGQ